MVQSVVYVVIALGIGLSKLIAFGLVIAKIVGTVASWLFLSKKSSIGLKWMSIGTLKEVAINYIDFPKYGLWPSFLNTVSFILAMKVLINEWQR
mgnify:CR=1 FL=1